MHCRARLAPYKVPKLVEFRAELPITIRIGDDDNLLLIAGSQQQGCFCFPVVDYIGDAGTIWNTAVDEEGREATLAERSASAAVFI